MQADLKVILFIHRIAQYMFLSPCASKHKFVFRLVGVLLALFSIPLCCVLLSPRVAFFKRLPTSCFVMDLANFFMGYTCLVIFCAKQNLPRRNWREKLASRVGLIERMLKNMQFSFEKNKKIVLKYWIFHGTYILTHSLQIYDWSSRYSFSIISSYFEFRIVHYWAGISTLMIFEWLNFIRRRYEHLDQYVNKIISQKVILVSLAVKELRLVGEVYKNLTELTVELNTLLSFHLFFLISVSMVLTLHGLSFSLVILYSLSSRLAGLNYVVAFFGNVVVLVLAYEKLRNKRQNILKNCLIISEGLAPGEIKNELRDLTNFMTNLPVKISAFGLFEIDFRLISSYVSVVLTYLIIILQFNMSFA